MADISKKFDKGVRLKGTTDAATLDGEIRNDSAANELKVFLDATEETIVTEDQTQVITNKTVDGTDATGTNTVTADAGDITYDNGASGLTATTSQAAIDEVEGRVDTAETGLSDHLGDAVDAHDASAISNVPSGNLAATEVQAALNELQTDVDTRALDSALTAHIGDAVDAHDASAISNIPSGNLAATEVQAALNELQTDVDTRLSGSALTTHESDTSTHGVTTIAGLDETQTFTNKTITSPDINTPDIDGGTASNTSRIILPQDTTTNLDALTDTEGLIAYDSTQKKAVVNDGTAWVPVGSGGGGGLDVFYKEDFEDQIGASDFTTGNNATFDNAGTLDGTLSDDTTTELAGDQSLKYVMSTTSTNDWIKSPNIAIDDKQSGNTVGITFYYTYDGTDDDIKVIGFDDTGAEVLTLATDFLKAASNPTRFSVQFPIPTTSTSINWGLQVVTGNNTKILIVDDVEISTNPFVNADTQDENVFSARIENNGTATIASQGGLNELGENAIASVNRSSLGVVAITFTTDFFSETPSVSMEAAAGQGWSISYGLESDTGCTTYLVDTSAAGLADKEFNVIIQRQGSDYRQKTTNVVAYNSRNAENLIVEGAGNGGTSITADVTNVDFTEVTDSGFGGANWNGTQFTVPSDGLYTISGAIFKTTTTATGVDLYIDTVKNKRMNDNSTTNVHSFSRTANFTEGQVLSIRMTGSVTLSNNTDVHSISITKIGVGDLLGVPLPRTCYIKDVKADGTAGGTFTLGAFRTRDLNDLSGDTEFVTLSSNQFTLSEGKYNIEAFAPAFRVGDHQPRLYNITDSSSPLLGTSEHSPAGGAQTTGIIMGSITITSSKTFEVQHHGSVTGTTTGFGEPNVFGSGDIYTQVKITKVA